MRFNGRVADVHRACTLAADPQAVWDVLADFGAISTWADAVDHSCLLQHDREANVGSTRRIQIGRETLVERITEFAPPFALGYDIEGLPRQLGRIHARWQMNCEESATRVTLTNTVEIGRNPAQRLAEYALCHAMARRFNALLDALARRMEATHV
jgi:hypothetical protein